jgi:hypothetical protein
MTKKNKEKKQKKPQSNQEEPVPLLKESSESLKT